MCSVREVEGYDEEEGARKEKRGDEREEGGGAEEGEGRGAEGGIEAL
jgi:hypothetical protein